MDIVLWVVCGCVCAISVVTSGAAIERVIRQIRMNRRQQRQREELIATWIRDHGTQKVAGALQQALDEDRPG